MLLKILFVLTLLAILPMVLYVGFLISSRTWTFLGLGIWKRIVAFEKSKEPQNSKKLEEAELILMQLELNKDFIDQLGSYYETKLPDILFDMKENWSTIKNLPLIWNYIYSIVLGWLYLVQLKLRGEIKEDSDE
jgi:hypothetical protein